ncbi:MAG: hypothetical protein Q8P66_01625 [Candidatus Colwellbacteria bacterium]|nr:hypothetical protein [Candidatus Colwellbacteria bacterium]
MLVFTASLILTAVVAFIQTTNWILLGNIIKPDLILVTLVTLALINHSWIRRTALITTAALILKFTPGLALLDFIFVGAALVAILLAGFLPWRQPVSLLVAILVGTVMINVDHLSLLPLIYELILNLLLGFILFNLLKLVHVSEIKLQKSRF